MPSAGGRRNGLRSLMFVGKRCMGQPTTGIAKHAVRAEKALLRTKHYRCPIRVYCCARVHPLHYSTALGYGRCGAFVSFRAVTRPVAHPTAFVPHAAVFRPLASLLLDRSLHPLLWYREHSPVKSRCRLPPACRRYYTLSARLATSLHQPLPPHTSQCFSVVSISNARTRTHARTRA